MVGLERIQPDEEDDEVDGEAQAGDDSSDATNVTESSED